MSAVVLADGNGAALSGLLVALALLIWPAGTRQRGERLIVGPVGPVGAVRPAEAKSVAGQASSTRRQASPGPLTLAPDVLMELVAAGLRGGLSVVDALSCAASVGAEQQPSAIPARASARRGRESRLAGDPAAYLALVVGRLRAGLPAEQSWLDPPGELDRLARAMVLAELSGAPAADVVARAARDARTAAQERVEIGAARLGVRLVLPLGLAVLPGFVLLAVAPIVLGLATSVLRPSG